MENAMKKTVVVLIMFAAAGALLWWWAVHPTVHVVRTLEDLKARRAIELPGGTIIRLGISGTESYVGGGVLLYCFVERVKGRFKTELDQDRLGPIAYEVDSPWDFVEPSGTDTVNPWKWNQKKEKFDDIAQDAAYLWTGTHDMLYIALVQTPQKGRYNIRFVNLEGEQLGRVSVSASEPSPHPWQPVSIDRNGFLINHPNPCAALPHFNGLSWGRLDIGALPRLPLEADAAQTEGFRIAVGGKKLALHFPRPMSLAESNLLARWWVNGKPVIPPVKPTRPPGLPFNDHEERESVQVNFRVAGGSLRAAPGDTIALQLLHLPGSWEPVYTPKNTKYLLYSPRFDHPSVSNRIEFTYEGK